MSTNSQEEEDEAFIGLIDEDTGQSYNVQPGKPTAPAPVPTPAPGKRKKTKVVKRTKTPAPSTPGSKPVGFYKEDGKTKPITRAKGKRKQKTKVVKKFVPPAPAPVKPVDPYVEAFDAWAENLGWDWDRPTTPSWTPGALDEETVRRYGEVPVPESGPLGREFAPLVRWGRVEDVMPRPYGSMVYHDYIHPDAPHGLLPRLRNDFRRNREYVTKGGDPVNTMLIGPPGTGSMTRRPVSRPPVR